MWLVIEHTCLQCIPYIPWTISTSYILWPLFRCLLKNLPPRGPFGLHLILQTEPCTTFVLIKVEDSLGSRNKELVGQTKYVFIPPASKSLCRSPAVKGHCKDILKYDCVFYVSTKYQWHSIYRLFADCAKFGSTLSAYSKQTKGRVVSYFTENIFAVFWCRCHFRDSNSENWAIETL